MPLARCWRTRGTSFLTWVKLATKDKRFQSFVLRHVDETSEPARGEEDAESATQCSRKIRGRKPRILPPPLIRDPAQPVVQFFLRLLAVARRITVCPLYGSNGSYFSA